MRKSARWRATTGLTKRTRDWPNCGRSFRSCATIGNSVAELQQKIRDVRSNNGSADHAAEIGRIEDEMRKIVGEMKDAVDQVDEWGVALRDIGTGLIDFPALANGRPIWLCWRLGEGDIGWWHEADSGFDSRRRLHRAGVAEPPGD